MLNPDKQTVSALKALPKTTIVAVHEGMIPLLEKGGVGRRAIRVLRNPVTPWRTQRVVAEQNSDVIFVGRLERDKGVDTRGEGRCASEGLTGTRRPG